MLMNFMLSNADTYLKTLLLNVCSNFMPVPLIYYETLDPESMFHTFEPRLFEELFYSYEKFKSILCFKLSSSLNKSPKGCTSITNSLF